MVAWCKNKTKTTMTLNWKHITRIFFACIFLILVCEVLIYYVVLLQCSWPNIDEAKVDAMSHNINEKPLRVMILSDTHLLGFRNGHWFDKLRREWQMYRSFQSVMSIHSPEVIFFLGDLFDEGLWADDDIFQIYVSTFRSIFHHSSSKKSYVVAGNHDIGFHYSINKHLTNRFMLEFDAPPVKLVNIRGNHFVLINSMAMEGDKCFLCKNAEKQLHRIVADVNCSLHFPLYRQSNQDCDEPDADESVENFPFRPKWECLSKESTDTLLSSLKPRAVFSGHSHHSCFLHHKSGIPEWTVASFNWRNKHNPSFILTVQNAKALIGLPALREMGLIEEVNVNVKKKYIENLLQEYVSVSVDPDIPDPTPSSSDMPDPTPSPDVMSWMMDTSNQEMQDPPIGNESFGPGPGGRTKCCTCCSRSVSDSSTQTEMVMDTIIKSSVSDASTQTDNMDMIIKRIEQEHNYATKYGQVHKDTQTVAGKRCKIFWMNIIPTNCIYNFNTPGFVDQF
ncbi:Metallophosphoesterase 1 [Nymphon striatum]|nr:Metallophosphoesterase 1 [Nymphon striatum]